LAAAAAMRMIGPLHQFALHTTSLCALFAHSFTSQDCCFSRTG
jgi:hypothetical protein